MSRAPEIPVPGQRWVSESEAELGLGIVLEAEFGRVTILFPAVEERRLYALESAPIRRVRFDVGDKVALADGSEVEVTAVHDQSGLIEYEAGGKRFPESQLSDALQLNSPWDRLLSGRGDDLETFRLRKEALDWRQRIRSSPVRGFTGARIDLIPHQMSIASEVTSRLLPRVLLADEVGLGKTIEACLILHRLHLTGRAQRVLIIVPEPLIHQWFVELLRRFNLLFAIFDEERCVSLEAEANPFLDSQLVLTSVALLEGNPRRAVQVIEGEWDLVIVDEAHHLEWSEEAPSEGYRIVAEIAQRTPGILLLTATPEQLGPEGHFARLKLIDPDRYDSLEAFRKESRHYRKVAAAIDAILAGKQLDPEEQRFFEERSAHVRELSLSVARGEPDARQQLAAALVDEFGIGRSLFRNRRKNLSGFPERKLESAELPAGDPQRQEVVWLADLLRKHEKSKFLVICSTRKRAESIQHQLQKTIQLKSALFHEDLPLMTRDRNAAFFAEEEGARVLICSEIGSEGRNFQFAHHLILFDLPENPDLLEQRIGRLDRIGQTETIRIHVPFQTRTRSEVLLRWYHEGLNAFERTCEGGSMIAAEVREQLLAAIEEPTEVQQDSLIRETKKVRKRVSAKLEAGNDRLLDLNSFKPELANRVIAGVRQLDEEPAFEEFAIRMFDELGLHLEELAHRRWLIRTGHLRSDAFPGLPDEGISATFERSFALSREDIDFLTIDHPVIRGALDILLGGENGNACMAEWIQPGPQALFLEVVFSLECLAPAGLHVDRFLAPLPIRIVVDHQLKVREQAELDAAQLRDADLAGLLEKPKVRKELLPAMLEKAESAAALEAQGEVEKAIEQMQRQLTVELDRLEDLQAAHHQIHPDEIPALREYREALHASLSAAKSRVEAVRLILRKPE